MVPFPHWEPVGFALYFLNKRQKLRRTFSVALQKETSVKTVKGMIVMTQASFANIKLLKRGAAATDNSAKYHMTIC